MKIHHYNKNGQPCDKFGKVIRQPEIVADGESIHVNMLFMDAAQRTVHDEAFTDNGQAAYEQRIDDAWKNSPTNTADNDTTATHADSAAAYEQRICNAWKNSPADYAA